jgi:hypothetical protein
MPIAVTTATPPTAAISKACFTLILRFVGQDSDSADTRKR